MNWVSSIKHILITENFSLLSTANSIQLLTHASSQGFPSLLLPPLDTFLPPLPRPSAKVVAVLKLRLHDGNGYQLKEDDGDHDDGEGLHAGLVAEDRSVEDRAHRALVVMVVRVATGGGRHDVMMIMMRVK